MTLSIAHSPATEGRDAMRLANVRRWRRLILPAVSAVLFTTITAVAAPGDLDPTFDGDGRVTTDFAGGFDGARGIAIQADGKIVAAGVAICDPCAGPTTIHDFALARYNRDGSLDTTFGEGDGKVTTDFSAGADEAFAVAIQADGKIVAGGSAAISGVDFALARYNADGSLDPTFDGDGKVTTDYGFGSSQVKALAIQADGKIVAAGYGSSTGFDFFLARYNSNGSLDPGFGNGGRVTFLGFGSNNNQANGVAIQADAKIVASGCTSCSSSAGNFALVRLNPNGSHDGTFDGEGLVTTDFLGDEDQANDVAIQADGKIVVAGFASVSFDETFALARYNVDGSLDPTFDGDGRATTQFGSGDRARELAIQRDGKIVAAGVACAFCFAGADFGLARYNIDGSLDTTFSGDGKVMTDFGFANDQASAVALQGDGKIVAAGVADGDFALARYKVCRVTSRRSSIPCR
jgi:uncharacterized delta-60 repeat protein